MLILHKSGDFVVVLDQKRAENVEGIPEKVSNFHENATDLENGKSFRLRRIPRQVVFSCSFFFCFSTQKILEVINKRFLSFKESLEKLLCLIIFIFVLFPTKKNDMKCSSAESFVTEIIRILIFRCRKIGYAQSEDEKLAKPKHRIIADGYGQRGDEVVSVSVGNSHTDPAGVNFDMNDLNSGESDGMGIANYLCNIMNRRNADTLTRTDFTEPTTNCGAPYASSCADNNSEISMSFRHVSVGSRRNSIDSQMSQMSVKMSETNIKASLESHSQQHKSVNMKQRQRNYLYARRTNHRRRASNSSVESQRMTNQLRNIEYKHPICNTMGRQIERRSAIAATATTADIADIQQIFSQNVQMQHTSDDDDQSIDELQHSSNALVPLSDHQRHRADSVDSLDVSNDKQAAIEQMLKNILKNSTEKQIEALLNTCDRNGLNGIGKSGRNSTRNQRHSHNKIYAPNIEDVEQVDVASSISSSLDVDCIRRLDGTQSSFSDQSLSRMKTRSQSSKGSCDVGIQANDYDIASHTRRRSREDCPQNYQYDDDAKDNLPEKFQSNYRQHQDDETNQLLPYRKRDVPTIVRKDTLSGKHLSESEKMEKLKKLLLPST